ncbi:hypothetical protein SMMN14_07905, partial [Sphaerulina musiva]
MATTIRSFPASTTTQRDVDSWQAWRGQTRVHPPSRFSRFDETSSAARKIHQTSSVPKSTHRHDFSGSSPSVPGLCLKTAQEPRAPDAQPPTWTIHHHKKSSSPPAHLKSVTSTIASSCRPSGSPSKSGPLRLAQCSARREEKSLLARMEALLALLKGVARRSKLLGVRETLFSFGTIWMDGIGIGKDTGAEGDIIGRNSRGRFGGDNGKMLRRRW